MNILIVEDYPQVAKRVARLTREILGDSVTTLKCVPSFQEAEAHLLRFSIDLLLLDLNLGGRDGFDLLKRAVAKSFQTIVISANGDRALEAFEHGVLDFVPKPFDLKRMQKAFSRLNGGKSVSEPVRYLAVKELGRIRLVEVQDILYIKGAGNYSELVLSNGSAVLHEKNLEGLTLLLNPHFERIHKSYLVRLAAAEDLVIHGGGRYSLVLKNDEVLPVGRTRYKELRRRLC